MSLNKLICIFMGCIAEYPTLNKVVRKYIRYLPLIYRLPLWSALVTAQDETPVGGSLGYFWANRPGRGTL